MLSAQFAAATMARCRIGRAGRRITSGRDAPGQRPAQRRAIARAMDLIGSSTSALVTTVFSGFPFPLRRRWFRNGATGGDDTGTRKLMPTCSAHEGLCTRLLMNGDSPRTVRPGGRRASTNLTAQALNRRFCISSHPLLQAHGAQMHRHLRPHLGRGARSAPSAQYAS